MYSLSPMFTLIGYHILLLRKIVIKTGFKSHLFFFLFLINVRWKIFDLIKIIIWQSHCRKDPVNICIVISIMKKSTESRNCLFTWMWLKAYCERYCESMLLYRKKSENFFPKSSTLLSIETDCRHISGFDWFRK